MTGKQLNEILTRHGFGFSKSLGQNFLCDEHILGRIADCADLRPEDTVLEIGPGAGTLTRVMAQRCRAVTSVEIDRSLLPVLEETLAGLDNTKIINADFLQLDLDRLYAEHLCPGFKLVANLPYYITTPIIMKLLESGLDYTNLTVLVQKEVAYRMAAKPGTPDYGALSCAVQYYCTVNIGLRLPPGCFFPPPKVESTVVTLTRRQRPQVECSNPALLFRVMHAAFAHRRKTLANNLISELALSREQVESLLDRCGLDRRVRGEQLSNADFARIAEFIDAKEHNLP